MATENKKIGVGFGIMLLRSAMVLLGHRNDDAQKASSELHGEGTWTMPGGKLHFGESFEEGCIREVKEETGIDIKPQDLKLISVANDVAIDAHFVTLGFLADKFLGEPRVMEPDEITEWKWFAFGDLPQNLYHPSKKVLDNYLKNKIYGKNQEKPI